MWLTADAMFRPGSRPLAKIPFTGCTRQTGQSVPAWRPGTSGNESFEWSLGSGKHAICLLRPRLEWRFSCPRKRRFDARGRTSARVSHRRHKLASSCGRRSSMYVRGSTVLDRRSRPSRSVSRRHVAPASSSRRRRKARRPRARAGKLPEISRKESRAPSARLRVGAPTPLGMR